MKRSIFNVKDHGAKGDGKAKDTQSIQKAIGLCAMAGGGTVYFPPGRYLSGTLHLKSNVTLHLDAGATLLGSTNKKDYEVGSDYTPNQFGAGCLICGDNLDNITIEGRGVIDGQGPFFWTSEMLNSVVLKPKEFRPRYLIYLARCRDITMKDITLTNSPCINVWLTGCDRANLAGMTILNPHKGPNADGINVDSSQNVRISDCYISAGDDCIALKSGAEHFGSQQPCTHVTVTNCILSSTACGIRVGYEGDGPINNCVFSNLVIHGTDIGIDIISILPAPAALALVAPSRPSKPLPGDISRKINEGAQIRDITFSNVVMEDVNRPIFLWLGTEVPGKFSGRIEDISLNNIRATANNACYFGGMPENLIRNINLNNIKIKIKGEMPEKNTTGKPSVWGYEKQPYAFYFQNMRGLKLRDIQVNWEIATGPWENALRFENIKGLEVGGLRESQGGKNEAAIHITEVDQAFIHGCYSEPNTGTFLSVNGRSTQKITVIGNELSEAKRAFRLGHNVKSSVLFQTNNHLPRTKKSKEK